MFQDGSHKGITFEITAYLLKILLHFVVGADTYDAKVNRNIQISSPEELKEYLKAEAGKAAADAESPEKAEASEPVQKDGSEQ